MEEEVIKDYSRNITRDITSNSVLTRVFFKMFTGLLLSAVIAWYAYSSGLYLTLNYTMLAVLEIVVVLLFSFLSKKLPAAVVNGLFYVYSLINGLTLGVIFAVYDMPSISLAFVGAAVLFGGLGTYGYVTKRDLSKFGTILMWTLIAGIVVSLVNIFLQNSFVDLAINWVMLFVFCGLTAFDLQKVKYVEEYQDQLDMDKIHVYLAMELYLDFINIFLRLLSLTGKRK